MRDGRPADMKGLHALDAPDMFKCIKGVKTPNHLAKARAIWIAEQRAKGYLVTELAEALNMSKPAVSIASTRGGFRGQGHAARVARETRAREAGLAPQLGYIRTALRELTPDELDDLHAYAAANGKATLAEALAYFWIMERVPENEKG